MASMTESYRLPDFLKWEEDNRYSREKVTVASGETLSVGEVVGRVTATGKIVAIDFSATDGSETAYGIMAADCDASDGDTAGVAIVRDALISDDHLIWPSGATSSDKSDALATLAGKGIIVRDEA
jgi:hypothetical protein